MSSCTSTDLTFPKAQADPFRSENQCRVDSGQTGYAEKVIKKLSSAKAASSHMRHIERDSLVRAFKLQTKKLQVLLQCLFLMWRAPWTRQHPKISNFQQDLHIKAWWKNISQKIQYEVLSYLCCAAITLWVVGTKTFAGKCFFILLKAQCVIFTRNYRHIT